MKDRDFPPTNRPSSGFSNKHHASRRGRLSMQTKKIMNITMKQPSNRKHQSQSLSLRKHCRKTLYGRRSLLHLISERPRRPVPFLVQSSRVASNQIQQHHHCSTGCSHMPTISLKIRYQSSAHCQWLKRRATVLRGTLEAELSMTSPCCHNDNDEERIIASLWSLPSCFSAFVSIETDENHVNNTAE